MNIEQLQKEIQQYQKEQRRGIIDMIDRNIKFIDFCINDCHHKDIVYCKLAFKALTTLITRLIQKIEMYGSNNTLLLKINQMLVDIVINDDEHIHGCCEDVNEWMLFYEDFNPDDMIIDWF